MAKSQTVSYSEIDTHRQCKMKHQLAYKERWASTDPENEALGRGTLFHLVMETHYGVIKEKAAGIAPGLTRPILGDEVLESAREAVGRLLWDDRTGSQTDRQALVSWIYDGYLSGYGLDPDWQIVALEQPLEAWLPTENGGRSRFKLAGTVDMVVRDFSAGGGLWIVDHKTCKDLPKQKDFDMEDQTALYTYLMKAQGYDIRGAIYNHCRTFRLKGDIDGKKMMTHEERFKRTHTVRTDDELRIMALEALDEMREAYRKRTRDAPRTPDGERCGWKCGFTEACLAARKGRNLQETMRGFGFEVQLTKPGPTFKKKAEADAKKSKG